MNATLFGLIVRNAIKIGYCAFIAYVLVALAHNSASIAQSLDALVRIVAFR